MIDSSAPRVLIVTSDPEKGRIVTERLRSGGLDPDFTTGAKQAISLIKSGRYPVIVSDVNMPGLSGADLLAKVTQQSIDITAIILADPADSDMAMACHSSARMSASRTP